MSDSDPTSTSISTLTLEESSVEETEAAYIGDTDGAGAVGAQALEEAVIEAPLAPALEEAARPTPEAAPAAAPPRIPFPVRVKRPVQGGYRSWGPGFQLELRVDVDGVRPMRRVSGDFYQASGSTITYHSSFRVDSPTVSRTPAQVVIEGLGSYTFPAGAPRVRVTIPRVSPIVPPAAATVQFFTLSGAPGARYLCAYQSPYFRSVLYEQDHEAGVTLFDSYDTGSLPSGGPARVLNVGHAYAEAGIGMFTSGVWNAIPAPPGGSWSNAELHAAMEVQFSLWQDLPQWAVWLLAAHAHEIGPGLYGIMFDQAGRQRQGCAVFHQGIGGTTADRLRLQLYTYVHELGHCFNLLHSWQKGLAQPPAPNRPASPSWMNYPWYYPGGAGAFWSAFPFQFDDLEVVHLRHAFRGNVIMGGNPFSVGSALVAPEALADPIEDQSGLTLELESAKGFGLGEPVVIEIKLRARDTRGKTVASLLHPNYQAVQVAIRKPSGRMVVYEPLLEHCAEPELIRLDSQRPAIYESAYIGYGKGGIYFDEVGPYQIRAVYAAIDGSQIVSNVLNMWVRPPLSPEDQQVAEFLIGDQQGALFYLLGSDSHFLRQGNDALEEVLERHPDHPLAVYARLVKGMNLARPFKKLTREKKLVVREARVKESAELLGSVIDASAAGEGVDNITLNQTARYLARAQKRAGEERPAKSTLDRMVEILRAKDLKPHVMALVEAQMRDTLA
jgi:hypothetical protein